MPAADLLFASGPICLLIFLMTKKGPMPSARALPLVALLTCGIRLVWFGTNATLVSAAVVAGLLVALTPILIVWGAIFLFRTMEHCGAMETIRCWLNHLSRNRVAQVVLIGWSFQFLIEGASGFGTPAALAGPLLVGLGFPALRVAMACLILNSVPGDDARGAGTGCRSAGRRHATSDATSPGAQSQYALRVMTRATARINCGTGATTEKPIPT